MAKSLGQIAGELPQQAIHLGILTSALPTDSWEVVAVPGCSLQEEKEGRGEEMPWRESL